MAPQQNVFRVVLFPSEDRRGQRDSPESAVDRFSETFRIAGKPLNILVACRGTPAEEGGAETPIFVTVGTPHDREDVERALAHAAAETPDEPPARLCPPVLDAPPAFERGEEED